MSTYTRIVRTLCLVLLCAHAGMAHAHEPPRQQQLAQLSAYEQHALRDLEQRLEQLERRICGLGCSPRHWQRPVEERLDELEQRLEEAQRR